MVRCSFRTCSPLQASTNSRREGNERESTFAALKELSADLKHSQQPDRATSFPPGTFSHTSNRRPTTVSTSKLRVRFPLTLSCRMEP